MFNLLPRDTVFFDLFEGLATHGSSTAQHLTRLASSHPNSGVHLQRIREEEHHADDLAHRALERLDRTFITPFDREDIHTLVDGLDTIVDLVDALAKRITLYHISSTEPAFLEQCNVLVRITAVVAQAVHQLRRTRKLSDLSPLLIEVHRLENVGDDNHQRAVSQLFDGTHDPLHVMKWKEFYDYIEDAIDGCEDVTHTLERIMLKNG